VETPFKVHLKFVFNGADTWLQEGWDSRVPVYTAEEWSLQPQPRHRVGPDSSLPVIAVLTRVL